MKLLLAREIIDSETEMHYACHRSLQSITDLHSHDFYEIFLVTKGSLYHFINGAKEWLEAGTICFVRPSDVHHYGKDQDRPVELVNLAFPQRTMTAMLGYLEGGLDADALLRAPMPPTKKIGTFHVDSIRDKLHEILMIPGFQKSQIKGEVRALLADIFIRYFSNKPELSPSSMPGWLVDLAKQMRNKENFSQGLARLYELSGKSPEHLTRTIKKHLGKTPTEWINELRLHYAANLLVHTDETIMTICLEAGFENLSHFYHLFKERYRYTPAKFRKEYRKISIPSTRPFALMS